MWHGRGRNGLLRWGGIGLRSAQRHADVAFISSQCQTSSLQSALWACPEAGHDADFRAALAELQQSILAPLLASIDRGEQVPQRVLSRALDKQERELVVQDPSTSEDLKAHLELTSASGAERGLNELPSKSDGNHISAELFRVAIARRLRVPLLTEPSCCPMCGTALDIYMDHALVCQCGGDRTLRHHAVRDSLFSSCCRGGLSAERERAGLLPPRPPEDEGPCAVAAQTRRPADVWLPRGPKGRGLAIDFAITSGLRRDFLGQSAVDATAVTAQYEDRKRTYLDTEAQCAAAGFDFVPFILEAHGGGLGAAARRIVAFVASSAATFDGEEEIGGRAARIAGGLSVALMRESARAVVRRLSPCAEARPSACPDGWAEHWQ